MKKGKKWHFKPSYIIFIGILVSAIIILSPLFKTILTAIVLSYLFFPLYRKLKKYVRSETVSALVTIIFMILIILVPFAMVINLLTRDVLTTYLVSKQYISGVAKVVECNTNEICSFFQLVGSNNINPGVRAFLEDGLGNAAQFMVNKLAAIVLSIPNIMINLFIIIFIMYYLLKDGHKLLRRVTKFIPLEKKFSDDLVNSFGDVTFAVVYGNLIVAFIQGLLAYLGFLVIGVTSPALWGIMTVFFSLFPYLGAAAVWGPIAAIMALTGYLQDDTSTFVKGIILGIYGFFVISMVDNILKPKLIGHRAGVHPAFVLLGVIGGLSILGVVGIIVGPVILALAVTSLEFIDKQKELFF